ncbi:MAG TPA: hypothetical protein VN688_05140 [Gemmataceae bacterium]|nr:hypothetical protein [Gemmataceae bacterium]
MKRWLSTLCLLAVAGFAVAADEKAAEDKGSAKVRAVGLALHKPLPEKPGTIMYNPSGMTLDINVSLPGKFIVGVNAKDSKLESFTDDKKNDLFKGKARFGPPANWISPFMTRIDPAGEHCTIQVGGAATPGKGAEKILLKGSLMVQCGTGEKTTEKKEIALKTNEEVAVGDFKMKVNSAASFGSSLAVLSAEPKVKSVEFFDAAGKAIKAMPQGRSTNPFGPGGKPQAVFSYFLNGKMDKVSFKVTYFDKLESATVPLDLRLGLDLE